MSRIACARHRFPPAIIQRFVLSDRDIEDLLAERGICVTCETVRRSVVSDFGTDGVLR